MTIDFDIEKHRIAGLPPTAYYLPNFVSEHEEAYLRQKIDESPQPRWRQVGTGRRLQYLGGSLTKSNSLIPEPLPDYISKFPNLIARLQRISEALQEASNQDKDIVTTFADGAAPNQVLINEYLPGQGIAPHEDGPAYAPVVATLSLGSGACLDIYQYLSHDDPSPPLTATERPPTAALDTNDAPGGGGGGGRAIAKVPLSHIYLERRSLLIMSSALYQTHLHGIEAIDRDVLRSSNATSTTASSAPHRRADETISCVIDGETRQAVSVANEQLLGDQRIRDGLDDKGVWQQERSTRVSLTFRHVAKVAKGAAGLLGGLGGRKR